MLVGAGVLMACPITWYSWIGLDPRLQVNGTVYAIRYAWGGKHDRCCWSDGITAPCEIEQCPIMSSPTGLPANPFIAKIIDGSCQCIPPQKC